MVEISKEIEQLKEKISLHQVCYEVCPEILMVFGQQTQVGFELLLFGTHEHGKSQLTPGCSKCLQTHQDLKEIAEWIMPKDERDSCYEIEPFDSSLYMTAKRGFQPEVVLKIKILHKHGFDQPVDKCEEHCLKEMEQKLIELGINKGKWQHI